MVNVLLTELRVQPVAAENQRLRNVMWWAFSGAASVGVPAFGHVQIGALFFLIAMMTGGLIGLVRPVQSAPETHWSGLLEWCFDGHAIRPDLRA